jgi:hypothetical protein
VLFLVGIPGNIKAIIPTSTERFTRGNPNFVLAIASSPLLAQAPRSSLPYPDFLLGVTAGWLRDGVRSGKIPKPASVAPNNAADAAMFIALDQSTGSVPTSGCVSLARPVTVSLRRGDVFTFSKGALATRMRLPNGRLSLPRTFTPLEGGTVHVVAGPVRLTLSKAPGSPAPVLCRGT